MSDRYQGFVSTSIGQLFVKNLGLPNPTELERWTDGAPLVDGVVVLGGAGRLAEVLPTTLDGLGIASTTTLEEDARAKALVFDATGITDTAGLVALQEFFTPADAPPRDLPARRRARHAAGDGDRLGADRPARARGLHPLARQGDRPRRHRPARVRRPCRRRRDQLDARVPPVPQVGVRLGPGRPHRRPRLDGHRPGRRLDPAARRQGRPRHRRQPRHRRGDRPGAAPRRRDRRRRRRAPGRQRAPDPHDRARGRPPRPRHHRQGRPAADRPPPARAPRRRRRRRPQRRHHPRQEARQHGRGPLEQRHRGQPHRPRADHPRAARRRRRSTPAAGSSASPRSRASPATSARPTTRPPRPASSASSRACATSSTTASPSTPSPRASSSRR